MSDDPVTLAVIGTGLIVGEEKRKSASKKASKAQNRSAEAATRAKLDAEEAANKKTAGSVTGLSEQAKKSRRLQSSSLTREFAPPTLATPGLTGA